MGILFLTFWILLSYLVPLSLFVTMEIVKFVLVCSSAVSLLPAPQKCFGPCLLFTWAYLLKLWWGSRVLGVYGCAGLCAGVQVASCACVQQQQNVAQSVKLVDRAVCGGLHCLHGAWLRGWAEGAAQPRITNLLYQLVS